MADIADRAEGPINNHPHLQVVNQEGVEEPAREPLTECQWVEALRKWLSLPTEESRRVGWMIKSLAGESPDSSDTGDGGRVA